MPEEMISPVSRVIAQKVIDTESGDRLLEWGGKLFYFDRRKCLQVVNFASKLTLILVDVKMDDVAGAGNIIAHYLFDLYDDNPRMKKILELHFEKHPAMCFSKLHDRSAIATLNHTQSAYLDDGYRLYEYIENGILQTRKLNKQINRDWIFTEKINGKTDYFVSAEKYEKLLKERYLSKIVTQ
jgi:YHS domain-containing protein